MDNAYELNLIRSLEGMIAGRDKRVAQLEARVAELEGLRSRVKTLSFMVVDARDDALSIGSAAAAAGMAEVFKLLQDALYPEIKEDPK